MTPLETELLAALEVCRRYLPDDELADDRLMVDRLIAKAKGESQ